MLQIGAIVWGVRDLQRAIQFWSEALNYRLKREPDVDFAILVPKEGTGIQLSLNAAVTSPKPKRHHIDLFTYEQEKEVERLLQLGQRGWSGGMSQGPIMLFSLIWMETAFVWCNCILLKRNEAKDGLRALLFHTES